jgi:hypothetical protein
MTEKSDRFQEFVEMIIDLKKDLAYENCTFSFDIGETYRSPKHLRVKCIGFALEQEFEGTSSVDLKPNGKIDPVILEESYKSAHSIMIQNAMQELGLHIFAQIVYEANKQCSTK